MISLKTLTVKTLTVKTITIMIPLLHICQRISIIPCM